jgi:hypothetical protein
LKALVGKSAFLIAERSYRVRSSSALQAKSLPGTFIRVSHDSSARFAAALPFELTAETPQGQVRLD